MKQLTTAAVIVTTSEARRWEGGGNTGNFQFQARNETNMKTFWRRDLTYSCGVEDHHNLVVKMRIWLLRASQIREEANTRDLHRSLKCGVSTGQSVQNDSGSRKKSRELEQDVKTGVSIIASPFESATPYRHSDERWR